MAKAEYKETGLCGLCYKMDEGILITVFLFIKVFICKGCWSQLFRQFHKRK